jgi:hypothetical protein
MAAVNPVENLLLYNPTTVAFGKVEFKKTWANRNPSGQTGADYVTNLVVVILQP